MIFGSAEGRLDDALLRLRAFAGCPGCTVEEVAVEARVIAASWWLDVQAGGSPPEQLHLLVGELRRWCIRAGEEAAGAWERLERAGSIEQAEQAQRAAEAFRQAAKELRLYE